MVVQGVVGMFFDRKQSIGKDPLCQSIVEGLLLRFVHDPEVCKMLGKQDRLCVCADFSLQKEPN